MVLVVVRAGRQAEGEGGGRLGIFKVEGVQSAAPNACVPCPPCCALQPPDGRHVLESGVRVRGPLSLAAAAGLCGRHPLRQMSVNLPV
jgi:hypothetical protein